MWKFTVTAANEVLPEYKDEAGEVDTDTVQSFVDAGLRNAPGLVIYEAPDPAPVAAPRILDQAAGY